MAWAHPGLHHDIDRVNGLLLKSPNDPTLLIQRAHLFRLNGELERSLIDLAEVERLDPERRDVHVHRGLVLSRLGRVIEAEASLTLFLQRGPGSEEALLERARIRADDGRLSDAILDCKAAYDLGRDVEICMECGQLLERHGSLYQAAALYRDGLAQSGGAVVLRLALIDVLVRDGRSDDALAYVDEALANATVKATWHLKRGEILEAMGVTTEAQTARESALAEINRILDRRETAIHLVTRAEVLAALGRADEAIRDLKSALEKSPRFTKASELLAQISNETAKERIERP